MKTTPLKDVDMRVKQIAKFIPNHYYFDVDDVISYKQIDGTLYPLVVVEMIFVQPCRHKKGTYDKYPRYSFSFLLNS